MKGQETEKERSGDKVIQRKDRTESERERQETDRDIAREK